MPNIYTHVRFNRLILPDLPQPIQQLAEEYPEEYLLGAQGPDIFYVNMPLVIAHSNPGFYMHNHSFLDFLQRLDFDQLEAAAQSYFYGFALHFLLDSKLHPTVNALVDSKISHHQIEMELDRYLLERDGENPESFRMSDLIPRRRTADRISPVYAGYGLPTHAIRHSIDELRQVYKILRCPSPRKERVVRGLMKTLGMKRMTGNIMSRTPLPEAEAINAITLDALQAAAEDTPALMENLYCHLMEGGKLAQDFSFNFNGILREEAGSHTARRFLTLSRSTEK